MYKYFKSALLIHIARLALRLSRKKIRLLDYGTFFWFRQLRKQILQSRDARPASADAPCATSPENPSSHDRFCFYSVVQNFGYTRNSWKYRTMMQFKGEK